jgi:hypothetical protein
MQFAVTRLVGSGCAIGFAKALAVRMVGKYEIGALLMAEVSLATVDVVEEVFVVAVSG